MDIKIPGGNSVPSKGFAKHHILYFSLGGYQVPSVDHEFYRAGISLNEVKTTDDAFHELLAHPYDLFVIHDYKFLDVHHQLLQWMRQHNLPTKVIVIPKIGSPEDAVKAIKMGASDFIVQDMLDAGTLESILNRMAIVKEPTERGSLVQIKKIESALIGESPEMREVRAAVTLVAKSQDAVLITGESGTGKNIVAQLIHFQSDRKDRPMVAVNCATLPNDVVEHELFGHEQGAYTGALAKKEGALELANFGTLFLDEAAEMTTDLQTKLLRAIEHKRFRRLGGKTEIEIDVRVIAATSKNIAAAIRADELLRDLHNRIGVIQIDIPPLRHRQQDIPLLVDHFSSLAAETYNKPKQYFSEQAMDMLKSFDWPGNVREMRNIVERAVVRCSDRIIDVDHLPSPTAYSKPVNPIVGIPLGSSLRDAEKMIILQTLASVRNNKSKAARILGMSRKTLHNKLALFAEA